MSADWDELEEKARKGKFELSAVSFYSYSTPVLVNSMTYSFSSFTADERKIAPKRKHDSDDDGYSKKKRR